VAQIAQKFERFLETYRRPDGSRWGGQDLHNATGGVVTYSYASNLRKGRIENPGFEKLRAIAKAMNFPPELWFEDVEDLQGVAGARPSWFMDGGQPGASRRRAGGGVA
jgi:transcriptional regulator with XRE-family HTH domain